MISCEQVVDFCFDYIDGALPHDEQVRFRVHLAQCPDCVTFFETYRRTPEVSRDALASALPEQVRETVHGFLRVHCLR